MLVDGVSAEVAVGVARQRVGKMVSSVSRAFQVSIAVRNALSPAIRLFRDPSSMLSGIEVGSQAISPLCDRLIGRFNLPIAPPNSSRSRVLVAASSLFSLFALCCLQLLKRTIRVDHVKDYKPPKDNEDLDEITRRLHEEGVAPRTPSPAPAEPEPEPAHKPPVSSHKGGRNGMDWRAL